MAAMNNDAIKGAIDLLIILMSFIHAIPIQKIGILPIAVSYCHDKSVNDNNIRIEQMTQNVYTLFENSRLHL